LLGKEPSLVLYGGGNTSVKSSLHGETLLYVKGSGADLAQVERGDFTPVRLDCVQKLIEEAHLPNDALAQAVARCVPVEVAPRASIETLLHAVLPHKFVLHTHADSILALINTSHGETLARKVFGTLAPSVPFRESGFALAKTAHEIYRTQARADTIGLILLHHGVFSFGATAQAAYDNMLRLVELAERYMQSRGAWDLPTSTLPCCWRADEIAQLRCTLSRTAGFPLVLQHQDTPELRAFGSNPLAPAWWIEGPATPQHAVFVKRRPLFGRDVARYADEYLSELESFRLGSSATELKLDPAPRVIVDARSGTWAASIDAEHAAMTAEIYRHDMAIMTRASGHDQYVGLPRSAILDAEIHYGGFEARARSALSPEGGLLGEVALVGGDLPFLVEAISERGAEVAVLGTTAVPSAKLNLDAMASAPAEELRKLVAYAGGLDIVVLTPGMERWLDACITLLRYSPRGGRLALHGSASWRTGVRERLAGDGLRIIELPPEVSAHTVDALCAGNTPIV
jgi:rhamnose utilization protein RhaD (predicted bifunctional aldolase and dehydrogenase)